MTPDQQYEFCPWCGSELVEVGGDADRYTITRYYECVDCGWECEVEEPILNPIEPEPPTCGGLDFAAPEDWQP